MHECNPVSSRIHVARGKDERSLHTDRTSSTDPSALARQLRRKKLWRRCRSSSSSFWNTVKPQLLGFHHCLLQCARLSSRWFANRLKWTNYFHILDYRQSSDMLSPTSFSIWNQQFLEFTPTQLPRQSWSLLSAYFLVTNPLEPMKVTTWSSFWFVSGP